MKNSITIRDAAPDEAEHLSDLALRSKAYWGYPPEFMNLCVDELTVYPEKILDNQFNVAVAERDGEIAGFYSLERLSATKFELDALFVEPDLIGTGVGRRLVEHAQNAVTAKAGLSLLIQGDPNAEEFYLAMGAELVGSRESQSIPGRQLPLFEIVIDATENTVSLDPPYRRATSDDVPEMPELVNMAGHGLPLYLWAKQADEDESGWDVAFNRAKRGMGGFAFKNTVVREEGAKVAACLIGYPLLGAPQVFDRKDVPATVSPLNELEDLVPGTWYVNVLATYPDFRGMGFGTELLQVAETMAHQSRCEGLSLIVSDANTGARRLYERHGFCEKATRPIVKEDWEHTGQNWVLLVKNF